MRGYLCSSYCIIYMYCLFFSLLLSCLVPIIGSGQFRAEPKYFITGLLRLGFNNSVGLGVYLFSLIHVHVILLITIMTQCLVV